MKVYSGGFTAERLYRPEVKIIVDLQLQGFTKDEIRNKVFEDNLFQCRSLAAIKRLFSSVYGRTDYLDEHMKKILLNSSRSDQNAVLLYGFLARYDFPHDLVLELIHFNYKQYKNFITDGNVETFIDEKAEHYESVRNWTEKTRYKIKQVTMNILADAELVEKNGNQYTITPIPLSKDLQQYAKQHEEYNDLLLYTLND